MIYRVRNAFGSWVDGFLGGSGSLLSEGNLLAIVRNAFGSWVDGFIGGSGSLLSEGNLLVATS